MRATRERQIVNRAIQVDIDKGVVVVMMVVVEVVVGSVERDVLVIQMTKVSLVSPGFIPPNVYLGSDQSGYYAFIQYFVLFFFFFSPSDGITLAKSRIKA